MLSLIACQPERIKAPIQIINIRWKAVDNPNPNAFFIIQNYNPCNTMYANCQSLYWYDGAGRGPEVELKSNMIIRKLRDTLMIVKVSKDSLLLKINNVNQLYAQ